MTVWKLSGKEWDALDELRFSTTDAAVFRNATIILMSAVGRSKPSIAHDLGCSIGTVDNIRKHYRQRGLEGMVPGKPPGRTSRATPAYRAALETGHSNSATATGLRFQRLVAGGASMPICRSKPVSALATTSWDGLCIRKDSRFSVPSTR